jgi:hypothetical protein
MDYNIQKNLNSILEKLQKNVNEGKYNSELKEEAVKIITIIRKEYQKDIDEYLKNKNSIDNRYLNNNQLILDHSFMIEYVTTKKDIEELGHNLLHLHKSIIIDDNVRWEDQYLKLVDLFFERQDNSLTKSEFFKNLIYYRFKHDDYNSKYNIDINYTLREKAFYSKLKDQLLDNPLFISDFLKYDSDSGFERKLKEIFDIQNSFILDLVITKYDVLKHIPEKFKEAFLVNLFAINENLNAKKYLHPIYKNNTSFCQLFEL